MPECSETLMNEYVDRVSSALSATSNLKLDYSSAIQSNSRPNQSTFHQQWKGYHIQIYLFFFHDYSLSFLKPQRKDLQHFHFREQNLPRYFESSKSQESFFCACFCWKKFDKFYQQNRTRYFDSFVDQATPGFELGKKDLQSPALPLGHAAKMIQNR